MALTDGAGIARLSVALPDVADLAARDLWAREDELDGFLADLAGARRLRARQGVR